MQSGLWVLGVAAVLLLHLSGCSERREAAKQPTTGKEYVGFASFYGSDFAGKKTASGRIYDPNAMTAAHRTLPFGSRVRVTNLQNDRSVVVEIIDRGPSKKSRLIDLSLEAAKKLDMVQDGVVRVRLEVLTD